MKLIDEPQSDAALQRLYDDMAAANLLPLWTQRGNLMPLTPQPDAQAHVWEWSRMREIAARAGELVPVGRGGERRAIALANPGLPGEPYASPTLWAAIQYLGPKEIAPAHRHIQSAFRFVLEGAGVWTVVNGDSVAMRRGDLLLTPGWAWHEHQNTTEQSMVWLDGLDIPLVAQLDAGFFEFGPDELTDRSTPTKSISERLWGQPGLRPVGLADAASSPLVAYRWEHTDAALDFQLELQREGRAPILSDGHAAVRMTNPTNGRDALPRLRTEIHRLLSGSTTPPSRTVGSSVWQVFDGEGVIAVAGNEFQVGHGDLVTVPSWAEFRISAHTKLDLFTFNDGPVYEALGLDRSMPAVTGGER